MSKLCYNCGANVDEKASFCPRCGADLTQQNNNYANQYNQGQVPPQQNPYQQPYQQHTQPYPPFQNIIFLRQELSNKLRNTAIIWLITGILQLMIGAATIGTLDGTVFIGILILAAGVGNIIYASLHFGYAKTVMTNPASVLRTLDNQALYVVNIVFNAVIGGLLGIIGGIYAFSVRSFIQRNYMYFQQDQNGNQPPYNQGNPPYPPYQNTNGVPPTNEYQQYKEPKAEQPEQTPPTNGDKNRNTNVDQNDDSKGQ